MGRKPIDLTGQRFGRLTAIRPTEQRLGTSVAWECRCDCGNMKLAPACALVSGGIQSCGCLMQERDEKTWIVHFELLQEYVAEFGQLPMARTVYKDVALGAWVNKQKAMLRWGRLSREREARLRSAGVVFAVSADEGLV